MNKRLGTVVLRRGLFPLLQQTNSYSLHTPTNYSRISSEPCADTVRTVSMSSGSPLSPRKSLLNVDSASQKGSDKADDSTSSFEHIDAIIPCESVSDLRRIDFSRECPDQLNMSFAGCGFLGIYHLGAAKVLQNHGMRLLEKVDMFGGASAGALVSTLLAVRMDDPYIIQECVDWCLSTAEIVHRHKGGLLNPSLCLMSKLKDFLSIHLPEDAHLKASGRVFISITDTSNNKNMIISEYDTREDLIECMLSSSYVPYVTGKKAVKWKGKKYIDGGMTNNLPLLAKGRTILVTPFSGDRKDICPTDKTSRNWNVTINKENYLVNLSNIVRGLHAFFPPKIRHLKLYYERGQRDAARFLKREGMYEEHPKIDKIDGATNSMSNTPVEIRSSDTSLQYESTV